MFTIAAAMHVINILCCALLTHPAFICVGGSCVRTFKKFSQACAVKKLRLEINNYKNNHEEFNFVIYQISSFKFIEPSQEFKLIAEIYEQFEWQFKKLCLKNSILSKFA